MTTTETVHVIDQPPLRHCVIDRVARRNALSRDICEQLRTAVTSLPHRISMVLIDHEGDTFSSGADLKEIAPALIAADPPPSEAPTLTAIRRLFAAIEDTDVAVVAAVNGRCLAGGLELALACDLIAATPSARFFDAHLAGGLLPSGGASVRLLERVGRSRSFRLLVEGIELGADEALNWGLVDALFDDHDQLLDWARASASRMAGYPSGLFGRVKQELNSGSEHRDGPRFIRELTDLNSYLSDQREEMRKRLFKYLPADSDPGHQASLGGRGDHFGGRRDEGS